MARNTAISTPSKPAPRLSGPGRPKDLGKRAAILEAAKRLFAREGFAGASMDQQFDHGALIQELGKQCLETARKELESKSGPEFDRCFMGAMVAGHMHANDMLTVFQRHASPELKNVLGEAQRTVAAHLQQAKDISKRLDGGATKAPKTEDGPK